MFRNVGKYCETPVRLIRHQNLQKNMPEHADTHRLHKTLDTDPLLSTSLGSSASFPFLFKSVRWVWPPLVGVVNLAPTSWCGGSGPTSWCGESGLTSQCGGVWPHQLVW